MDINVIYTAKDGMKFNDPYECEEYEKRLGTEPGTVARARIDLKDIGEQKYVFGMLKVRHEGSNHYRTYVTRCVDEKLEDYVNVSELDVDKRWIRYTVSDVLHHIERYDDNALCEYEFLYFNHQNIDLDKADGYVGMRNMALWDAIGPDKRCERVSGGRR